jgi:hypothetical protein
MRDFLLDIVRNTWDLGCFSAVKVTGDKTSTVLDAVSDDRTVILNANFHAPILEFQGLFGMPNLDKLKILLGITEYQENGIITLNRQDRTGTGDLEPVGLHFANAAGDFQNDYRFMTAQVVTEKLLTAKPKKQPTWLIEFEPTVFAIQRLRMQAQANSDERLFKMRTENGSLKFYFGDHSTHAGEFVFENPVQGKLTREWSYAAKVAISVLDLAGDKVMRVSDEGMIEITVDSGLALYQYRLLAHSK